ncbi:MAG: 50S ribosomal protein L3 [Candidatus Saccharibacteria bacterium]|nr:50S ribosomal protein L3 [Candidatus Saccharibacteria bacterium]MCY4010947.1 50S ribosomal protein L3 [Candidatus Saccharibacteria bacterium]MCY4089044.1 50S ribosomal protein L3 [Candidatus Saccharibacteria bacterium]
MLLTFKLGMMSLINDQGLLLPVTLLKVEDNFISQIKTLDKDGYQAIQISTRQSQKVNKPQRQHFKKAKLKTGFKFVREQRLKQDANSDYQLGQKLDLSMFELNDKVHVTSFSKGKGFAGTVKRHNFATTGRTHGVRGRREPGSIGSVWPQKVTKGKKMAGRMGNKQVTVKNLRVALIDQNRQIIGIKGAIPGPRKRLVILKKG